MRNRSVFSWFLFITCIQLQLEFESAISGTAFISVCFEIIFYRGIFLIVSIEKLGKRKYLSREMSALNVNDLLIEEKALHVPALDELVEGKMYELDHGVVIELTVKFIFSTA